MTLPDDLLRAMKTACCYSPESFPKESPMCSIGKMKHPECAVAAVLRVLRESEAVPVPQRCEDPREQWVYALAWNECLAALAREFGEPT